MYGSRVVIADSNTRSLKRIKGFLGKLGYVVIGEAKDGLSALTLIRSTSPELVILDANLPVMDAWEVAEIIEDDRIAPVLMIVEYNQQIEKLKEFNLITPIVKPISEANLHLQAEMALTRYEQLRKMEQEILQLKETLEVRKLVEKAKGILMNKRGMNEQAAFRHIQQLSMNKRISKKAVAEAIILADSID